jgi:TM2 domain-containing membrane protein YozV
MAAPVYHGDLYALGHIKADRDDEKSIWIAYLLWFFFGIFGAHRYYMGRIGSGMMQTSMFIGAFAALMWMPLISAIVLVILAIWYLVDLVLIAFMN